MHIGIILDGNRRYAKKMMMQPWKGHEEGARKIEELLGWMKELKINEITLYCFSTENFSRENKEVEFLMKLFKREFAKLESDERLKKDGVRVNFIGKKEMLEGELQEIMKRIEDKTRENRDYTVNFAVAYGGRLEILNAAKKLSESGEEFSGENLRKNLWLKEDLDLIIRPGGEKRTSNFFPWQSAYSEWIFFDKMWPEFTKEDLKKAIKEFQARERRFGK